jgi:hypothetical protein
MSNDASWLGVGTGPIELAVLVQGPRLTFALFSSLFSPLSLDSGRLASRPVPRTEPR